MPSLPLKLRKESESKQFQAGDFPGSPVDKNLPCNAGDTGSIPGRGAKILRAAASGACAAHTVVNSAAMNTGVHVSFPVMFFSRDMLRSEIARSHDNSIFRAKKKKKSLFLIWPLTTYCYDSHSHLLILRLLVYLCVRQGSKGDTCPSLSSQEACGNPTNEI